jgi:hypothetical protein
MLSYTTGRQGGARYGPDGTRQDDLLLSPSQPRAAPSRIRNGGYISGRHGAQFDEDGIDRAPLRPEDSNSVAGGSDYTYQGRPLGGIAPGDSASANGQTRASGMRGRGGAATTAGPDGEDDDSRSSNRGEHSMHNDAPNGGSRVGTDSGALSEWQRKAQALLDSSENLRFQGFKGRQDWLSEAQKNRDNLEIGFHKLDAVDQSECLSLLNSINERLNDEKVEQVGGGRTVGPPHEPSRVNDHQEKGNVGSSTVTADRQNGPQYTRKESTLSPRDPPLSPLGRSTQGGLFSRPVEPNSGQEHDRRGTCPDH